MDQILQGLGVSFNINEVPIAGKNLFLDISEFEKLVQIPAEFMNIDSAIKDLIN